MDQEVETLIDAERIRRRVAGLAEEIAPRLAPDAMVISLLQGAFVFTADLVRAISGLGKGLKMDFLTLSSYGDGAVSSGKVRVRMDCRANLEGRQVVIVDTVLDSGTTLAFAQNHLRNKGAGEILSCVLLDKVENHTRAVAVDFVGFTIPDLFVVGYGIDAAERFRELPYIGHVNHG